MLRYLASGYRDYNVFAVPVTERLTWEIFVVADGEAAPEFADERNEPLKKGYLWVFPPGLTYGLRTGKAEVFRYAFCITSLPDVLMNMVRETGYFGRAITSEEIQEIDKIYHRMDHHFHAFEPLSALQVERAEIDLTLLLLDGVKLDCEVPLDKIHEQRIESVMAWYQEHMSECPTIDAAADSIHISAGHLRRTFQRARGCSPHKVFTELRLTYAKKMLSETSQTLVQIGKQCGFRSDSDFCRVFTKHTGVSPHKWRNHITQQEANPSHASPA